jgi:hypothetical protein
MTSRLLLMMLLVAACGDDSRVAPDAGSPDATAADPCLTSGGAACFSPLPSAPLARTGGAPDLSCATAASVSSVDLQMAGNTLDLATGTRLANATIDVFYDLNLTTPTVTATSDGTGAYTLTLPKPVPSTIQVRLRATSYYDVLNVAAAIPVDGQQISVSWLFVSRASGLAAIEAIGETDDPTASIFAMFVEDCRSRRLIHAIGTVAAAPSQGTAPPSFVPGVRTYYETGAPPVPVVRSMQTETDETGGLVAYHGPASGTVYLQMWGFVDAASVAQGAAGLRLISETAAPAIPDTIVVASGRITEGPL